MNKSLVTVGRVLWINRTNVISIYLYLHLSIYLSICTYIYDITLVLFIWRTLTNTETCSLMTNTAKRKYRKTFGTIRAQIGNLSPYVLFSLLHSINGQNFRRKQFTVLKQIHFSNLRNTFLIYLSYGLKTLLCY